MSSVVTLDRWFARHPSTAVLGYIGLLCALLAATWLAVTDILDRREAVRAASDLAAQLEGRPRAQRKDESQAASPTPTGSPFLEGETITVAGAALLQRIASAVTRAGGNIQSSQVELQGPQANDNYVGLVVSCEVEQAAVQALLYDIESGMPFLFIEQLTLQTPQGGMAADSGRMRVLLSVSGQWQGRR
jgi:general secretion pathway protein M